MTNIGRKRKKNGFTQVSNALLENENLSWRAKGLLCYMLSRPNNWKINKTDLYNKATEGRDAMQKALNELKEWGYLHIRPEKNKEGKIEAWMWEYDDIPFSPETTILENHRSENPQKKGVISAENQTTENPVSGKPSVWESSTYNNTVFKNKELNNNKLKEIKNIRAKSAISSEELEREFETIWKLYPRKIGKKKAFDSFKKARKTKKIPYEIIENGLYRYIDYLNQQETEERFIMHGSTWFNQEKWQDEYVSIAPKKKRITNAFDYYQANFGSETNESRRDGEIIDSYPTMLPFST